MSRIEGTGIGPSQSFEPEIPAITGYGKLNSEQHKLIKKLKRESSTSIQVRPAYLNLEDEKLTLLVNEGKISEEEKTERFEKATNFIDKLIANLGDKSPADNTDVGTVTTVPKTDEEQAAKKPKKKSVGKSLRGMRRAEVANSHMSTPGIVDYGKLTSEQWKLIGQLNKGEVTEEEVRTQFLQNETAKLNLLAESDKISQDEMMRRLQRFTIIIDRILENLLS